VCSFPCTVSGGAYRIVDDLEINDFSRGKIDISVAELEEERDAVRALGLID
jgi:malate dehydrogenase